MIMDENLNTRKLYITWMKLFITHESNCMDEIDKMGGMNDMDETWQYSWKFQHNKTLMTCKKWADGWHQWNILHDEVEHTYRINHIEYENLMLLMKLHSWTKNQSPCVQSIQPFVILFIKCWIHHLFNFISIVLCIIHVVIFIHV